MGFSLENITVNNVSGLLIYLIALKVFKNELDVLSYDSFVLFRPWNPSACDFMQGTVFHKMFVG